MKEKIMIQSRFNRIFHWLFALCVVLLLASGFYISNPVNLGDVFDMQANTKLQLTVGLVSTGVFSAWVYHHLITQAYKDIVFMPGDWPGLVGLMKYYFFMRKEPPAHLKYNAGQKLIYSSWVIVFTFMILSGLMLYTANLGNILPFPISLQKTRFYHFIGAAYFLGTVPLHVYLVFTEDPAKLQAMFTGWVRK